MNRRQVFNLMEKVYLKVFVKKHFRSTIKTRIINQTKNNQFNSENLLRSKNFWSKYTKKYTPSWHIFYANAGNDDIRNIPEDIFYSYIEPFYNDYVYVDALSDKNYFSELFPNIKQPETIVKNINGIFYDKNFKIISFEDAIYAINKPLL